MPQDFDFIRLDNKEFYKCPDKSIDYAVMERTNLGIVVPFNGNWGDIGSWEALWESKFKDKAYKRDPRWEKLKDLK